MYRTQASAPPYTEEPAPSYPYTKEPALSYPQAPPPYPHASYQYTEEPALSYPQAPPPYPHASDPQASYPQPPSPFPKQNLEGSAPVGWSTGLCDCFDDPSNCFITWCCPCITFGQIAEIVDKGNTSCGIAGIIYYTLSCAGCACLYSRIYRTKLRGLYSLNEAPCGDCLVHWCCDLCAICQEYRELKIRGADPSLGWQGNVEKWNRAGNIHPPGVAQGMIC